MSYFASSGGFAGHGPARHLERLHDGLTALGQQVRQAIGRTVARAVADATQDGVRHLLGGRLEPFTLAAPRLRPYEPFALRETGRDPWRQEAEEPDRLDDLRDRGWQEEPPDLSEEDDPPEGLADRPRPVPWERALVAGLQAAAWWLGRQPGRTTLRRTLAVGLVAAVLSLFGGPAAVALAGVAVLALMLRSLPDLAVAATAVRHRGTTP